MSKQTVEGFFYGERDARTRRAAERILGLVRYNVGPFQDVLDVGCGVGTWLSVANSLGAKFCQGIEGPWIQEIQSLVVNREILQIRNLEAPWQLERDFDLGICLEVAEHISESAGQRLVENLATRCKIVLFSAAIPGQGGNGHINEQWPAYWQKQFSEFGMEGIDLIRPIIWDDESIPWWYRQNIIVFVRPSIAQQYFDRLAGDQNFREKIIAPLRIQLPVESISLPEKPSIRARLKRRVKNLLNGN